MSRRNRIVTLAVTLALVGVLPALATNGYFVHGVTTANKAMAGAGIALPQDPMAAALDPAAANAFDSATSFSLGLFNPNREYKVVGNPSGYPGTFGLTPGTVSSGNSTFFMPGIAWSRRSGANGFAIAFESHGGMNTRYPTATYYGGGTTGVDLSQMFLDLSYAREIRPGHSIGIAGIVAYQLFEARGLSSFTPMSSDPQSLSNQGHDSSYGFGVRVGYRGQLTPRFSVAAAYTPKIEMSKFERYAGLFADSGSFDIPSNWEAGVAYRVREPLTVALDVQHIRYSEIASVGGPMLPSLAQRPLGSTGAAGFGWQDVTVYKLGLQYEATPAWILRTGFSTGNQPIPDHEVLFNILAPGVIQRHVSAGFTYRPARLPSELNVALTYALGNTLRGDNKLEAPGQQRIELSMDEWELELGWTWRH